MSNPVSFIRDGYHAITPYITVKDGKTALDFYARALGATIRKEMREPSGRLAHAEFELFGSRVMLSEEFPELGAISPTTLGGRTSSLCIYVEDVDAVVARAVEMGATLVRPVSNQFYGDRMGVINDPVGHTWTIATHIEDVSDEEIVRRMSAMSH